MKTKSTLSPAQATGLEPTSPTLLKRPPKRFWHPVIAVLGFLLVLGARADGDSGWHSPPHFLNATVSGATMTITVTNFRAGPLVVDFNGIIQNGVIYNQARQTITIPTLTPFPPPGTFLLSISKGDDDSTVQADVSIGLAGPQGPVGAPGPPGPPGVNDTLAVTPLANMVWIHAGSFAIGSPVFEMDRGSDESPQTSVTIPRGFWMGIHEVTQGEYRTITGSNPSHFTGDTNLPVEQVTWQNAVNYCAVLTTSEKANGHISGTWAYRLPTEAEWEYAARAGTATRFSYGDDNGYASLANYGWYNGNSGFATHPVGSLAPNAWGLFDMYGNVWEWCNDWYAPYAGGGKIDPHGPATGSDYAIRGGGYIGSGVYCRSAARLNAGPGVYANSIGFRVVLAPSP